MDYKQFEGHTPENKIIEAMCVAQYGTREQNNIIEEHIKEYFTRWPHYKDKLSHLEWYHLFLDFSDKIYSENQSLKLELQKQKEIIELTAELVTMIKSLVAGSAFLEKKVESLIKKSSEI